MDVLVFRVCELDYEWQLTFMKAFETLVEFCFKSNQRGLNCVSFYVVADYLFKLLRPQKESGIFSFTFNFHPRLKSIRTLHRDGRNKEKKV